MWVKVTAWVPQEDADELQRLAEVRDMLRPTLIRFLLTEWLARQRHQKAAEEMFADLAVAWGEETTGAETARDGEEHKTQ